MGKFQSMLFPFRQVLSSDHTEVHQSAVSVITLVVKAAQQALDEEKRKKNKHKGTVTQTTVLAQQYLSLCSLLM